jgi:hypothetical protein
MAIETLYNQLKFSRDKHTTATGSGKGHPWQVRNTSMRLSLQLLL